MNEANYGSLAACKRLIEAGIVVKTDCVWAKILPMCDDSEWKIFTCVEFAKAFYEFDTHCPAVSMAEVWRELPEGAQLRKVDDKSLVRYDQNMFKLLQERKPFAAILGSPDKLIEVDNPVDALIDLLIYIKSQ